MMKIIGFIILLNVITLSNVRGDDKIPPVPPIHNATTSKPTAPPLPPSSSTVSPTTSKTTTSSTTTTTTPAPNSTTATTTTSTTTATTSTTTTVPTTTTPSTTTVAPVTTTSAPPPKEGSWFVANTTGNYTCIFLKMGAIIEVNNTSNGSKNEEGLQINIPGNANAAGNCGENEQSIILTWSVNTTIVNSMTLIFTQNNSKFELENVTVALDPKNFPDAKDNKTLNLIHKKKEYATPETMSYKCSKPPALNLNTTDTNIKVGTITFFDLQVQAFGHITDKNFAEAKDCEPYETPDIVPIAVGCALMALIIVVLIGYLIGRRRNQARGYLSM